MQRLRRVGLETGALTDEELRYLDTRVVETVRPVLVARKIFPIYRLPHAGIKTWRSWKQTDMGEALITMTGEVGARDRVELDEFNVSVPVISRDFRLHWRDIEASRNGGMPIDTMNAENAARQVAETEDKLCLSGEFTGWRALGIEGLCSATGRNTTAGGDWSANALTYVANAIGELISDGFYGPYYLVTRGSWYAQLLALITNTEKFLVDAVAELLGGGRERILISDNLFASDGGTDSALVVQPAQENFELGVALDLTTFEFQNSDMNLDCKAYEVVSPRISRPTSIVEITGLT